MKKTDAEVLTSKDTNAQSTSIDINEVKYDA